MLLTYFLNDFEIVPLLLLLLLLVLVLLCFFNYILPLSTILAPACGPVFVLIRKNSEKASINLQFQVHM